MRYFTKILFFCCVFLALSACKEKAQKAVVNAPLEVKAIKVVPQNVNLSFEYPAKVQGYKETEVRARVGGILLKRNYIEGSRVEEGQVLFEIDKEQYQAAYSQAKAKLAQERAQLTAAQKQWERIEKLAVEGIVSQKAKDDARANLDSLKAAEAVAAAALKTAQLNLDYTTVRAPISGITSMENQSEGSLISANGLLTNISQINPIYVIFSMSDNEAFTIAAMIEKGQILNPRNIEHGLVPQQKKDTEVVTKVKLNDGSFYDENGVINFINPSIDGSTGTVKLRAIFPNPNFRLVSGQFVRLSLDGLIRKDAVVLPKVAVLQGAEGSFVYKINAEGKIEVANVKVGFSTVDGNWIIDEGLLPDDVVVTDGVMKVKAGVPAKPIFAAEEK